MAEQKIYAITRLSHEDALYLDIEGTRFDIAQYTSSFACNEIPIAQAMLGIGRRADDTKAIAAIHDKASGLRQMQRATVFFSPRGEYSPDGTRWPTTEEKLFDGYFVGFAYQKINGKVSLVANLIHWLFDLACSSCVSMNSHPANPAQLTAAAVFDNLAQTGPRQSAFVSEMAGQDVVSVTVQTDLWKGIKELFAKLANVRARAIVPVSMCMGDGFGDHVVNTRALRALARIEGPCVVAEADRPYKYGVALPVDTLGVVSAQQSIANAICCATVESYAYTTFWDKMVGELFPMFHMAIVPRVDSALVIADTPAFNKNYWKLVRPTEDDAFQQSAALERPLRAIVVLSDYASLTGAQNGKVPGNPGLVGGCFVAGSVNPDDGVVQYIKPPMWLEALQTATQAAGATTGASKLDAMQTLHFPDVPDNEITPATQYNYIASTANGLYGKYAQAVYVANMLRGKHGSLSGKLRFDIAPGSVIKIESSFEKFIGSKDILACDMFASVARVTISINCEASTAGTTLQLSHVRTDGENKSLRTSVPAHPLFSDNIHGSAANRKSHGCPLIDAYDLTAED